MLCPEKQGTGTAALCAIIGLLCDLNEAMRSAITVLILDMIHLAS